MNAPIATLPAAENDSRHARPVYFQSRPSAERHAIKRAMASSADGLAHPVEFARDVYRGGATFFAVELAAPSDDHVVLELTAAEVSRRQQAGVRAALERCGHELTAHELSARLSKSGSCFERIHLERVAQVKRRMRELELLLTVSVVVPDIPEDEPITSSERDSRYAESL